MSGFGSCRIDKLPVSGFNLAESPLADETVELFHEQPTVAFAGESEGTFQLGLRGGIARCTVEVSKYGAGSH
jgi:hypothetical protein